MPDLSNYRKEIIEVVTGAIRERTDHHVGKQLPRLVGQAERLSGRDNPDPAKVAELTTEFTALIGTAIGYRASPEMVRQATTAFIDGTFGLSYRRAMTVLASESPGSDGDITQIVRGGGLEVLTTILAAGISTPSRQTKTLPVRSLERQSDGESGSSRGETGSADYIPAARRIADSEYKGFTCRELADMLGYASKAGALNQVGRIRRELGESTLKILAREGNLARFDFRGVAHHFIRTKGTGTTESPASTALYTKAQALGVVQSVLALEGVEEERCETDAEGILAQFDKSEIKGLKRDGKYTGFKLHQNFVPVARAFYQTK